MKRIILVIMQLCVNTLFAQADPPKALTYLGRDVTIADAGPDPDDEFSPKSPSSVCVQGPTKRECYTTPEPAMDAAASIVWIKKDEPAILFSSRGGGVSGFVISYVLLRPSGAKDLEGLLSIRLSNQSECAFWDVPTISDTQIFVTADYVWGPSETHYSEHRYIVSAFVLKADAEFPRYYLEDQYMTVVRYDLDAGAYVLDTEKPEILRRLLAVKQR